MKLGYKFKSLASFLYKNIINDSNYSKKYILLKKEITLIEFSYWAAGFSLIFPLYFLIFLEIIWTLLSFILLFNLVTYLSLAILFIPLGLVLGFAFSMIIIYIYPDYKIYKRVKSLDSNTILAVIYMQLLNSAGLPPQFIFKILSKFPDFREVWVESKYINRLINLGVDILTALERAAKTTPESLWKELILGMKEVIATGGDLNSYLKQKREMVIDVFRTRYKSFVDFLGIVVEIYITLVIVGSIFVIILTLVAAMLGAMDPYTVQFMQKFLIYFFIPLVSLLLIFVIKESNPFSD